MFLAVTDMICLLINFICNVIPKNTDPNWFQVSITDELLWKTRDYKGNLGNTREHKGKTETDQNQSQNQNQKGAVKTQNNDDRIEILL